ncbi:MAG: hypothetical protein AAB492_04305 [Patescibacteria group bacterium]
MDDAPNTKTIGLALVISVILISGVFVAFSNANKQQGQIVLPAGGTYLGPTPTNTQENWIQRKGKIYPYAFLYPDTLSLGEFPNDPTDSVTMFIANTDANTNLFFRVETLTVKPIEYAQNWWKQYNWKGVSSVSAFTNSKGLTGYRAKYLDNNGTTPYDHVFFEVPKQTDLIIWISGKLFEPSVFDTLVDSVDWKLP